MSRSHDEHAMQTAFFEWLAYQYPYLKKISFAVSNAGKRTSRQGKWLKDEGLLAGVWDACIPWPTKSHPGLWLEFKIHPRKLTKEQIQWRDYMIPLGWKMCLVYTLEEAVSALKHYIVGFERDRFK
jgi:hypothetical protein